MHNFFSIKYTNFKAVFNSANEYRYTDKGTLIEDKEGQRPSNNHPIAVTD